MVSQNGFWHYMLAQNVVALALPRFPPDLLLAKDHVGGHTSLQPKIYEATLPVTFN